MIVGCWVLRPKKRVNIIEYFQPTNTTFCLDETDETRPNTYKCEYNIEIFRLFDETDAINALASTYTVPRRTPRNQYYLAQLTFLFE